jgi:peptide deformylase
MTLREIVSIPDPVLRRKARKVTDFGPELQTLIDDMVETMRAAPGVGLAAPQVAESLQVITIEYREDDEEGEEETPPRLYTLVNPQITRASSEMVIGTEGCLSVPGIVGEVERHEAITVKAQNRRGQPVTIKAKDWLARIFQHEINHLEGVLFTDLTDQLWRPEEHPDREIPLD